MYVFLLRTSIFLIALVENVLEKGWVWDLIRVFSSCAPMGIAGESFLPVHEKHFNQNDYIFIILK